MNMNIRFSRSTTPLSVILFALLAVAPGLRGQAFMLTRFTVIDAGTARKPDVVLIPGLSSSRGVWDAEAKLLAPNYRLHLVQVNGFAGQSAGPNADGAMLTAITEEMHAYISASKMHPAVIGHSLGGLLAMMLADKHPEDASKLVIVDALPFYALVMNPDATLENTKPMVEAMRGQMTALPGDQYKAMQPMIAAALVKDPEGQKIVAANSGLSDRTVVTNAMIEDMQTDLRPDLASIKTPALMLYPFEAGSRQGTEPSKVDALYTTAFKPMPHVTLKRIDDSRHFVMYDQPEQFDGAVEAFLK